ncbi:ribosomal protein S18 [Collybia nuda]|uniref:Small ribosomal subunit protein bS18m n=1 Tax=Collybia nuda TaxID=64659 RepID=A0A9P5YB11_9AGAR|nr:ribosomal protein S18 [Collybia nuda]
MFSILRNVACRRTTFATARRALASTHTPATNPETLDQLANVLKEEGTRQPTPTKPKTFAAGASRDRRREQQLTKWKPFTPNRLLRPHEFTYKTRINGPRKFTRRPAVGPAPNIARYSDIFHQLNIDPLSQAQNPAILREFMSEMGKIYSRNITGLTSKSQRRIGKAIRRAKMMGVIPILSKPPKDAYTTYYKRT